MVEAIPARTKGKRPYYSLWMSNVAYNRSEDCNTASLTPHAVICRAERKVLTFLLRWLSGHGEFVASNIR